MSDEGQGRVEAVGVWPHIVAPAQYENPAPGWEDARVADLALIWKLAREVGYAVGVHGSLKRDMDLIAAPWTEEAVGNAALIEHLCKGLPATRTSGPEHKPHGRVAVTLQIDGYYKPIDLSIMPRITAALRAERIDYQRKRRADESERHHPVRVTTAGPPRAGQAGGGGVMPTYGRAVIRTDTPTEQLCALMWMQARLNGIKLPCPYKRRRHHV